MRNGSGTSIANCLSWYPLVQFIKMSVLTSTPRIYNSLVPLTSRCQDWRQCPEFHPRGSHSSSRCLSSHLKPSLLTNHITQLSWRKNDRIIIISLKLIIARKLLTLAPRHTTHTHTYIKFHDILYGRRQTFTRPG
jgi:hypothetical protein